MSTDDAPPTIGQTVFSVRAERLLTSLGYVHADTLGDVTKESFSTLRNGRYGGVKVTREIRAALARFGLDLRDCPDESSVPVWTVSAMELMEEGDVLVSFSGPSQTHQYQLSPAGAKKFRVGTKVCIAFTVVRS